MTITVNGESTTMPADASVRDLVGTMGLPEQGIAVAVDGAVVPKGQWAQPISPGSVVEIVTAVQGG